MVTVQVVGVFGGLTLNRFYPTDNAQPVTFDTMAEAEAYIADAEEGTAFRVTEE